MRLGPLSSLLLLLLFPLPPPPPPPSQPLDLSFNHACLKDGHGNLHPPSPPAVPHHDHRYRRTCSSWPSQFVYILFTRLSFIPFISPAVSSSFSRLTQTADVKHRRRLIERATVPIPPHVRQKVAVWNVRDGEKKRSALLTSRAADFRIATPFSVSLLRRSQP